MELTLTNIGNSKGIRLPKTILETYNIQDKLEIILEKGYFIVKPKAKPRQNWENAFQKMNENGDDTLLIETFFDDENLEEWM
ncbi:MAG: AbrB/MazE/SpoVT family DNA-binding domain-containing protein [Capnocytophaga sp.]|nr:AbrB/MazE/SpoVT family DNA-binding domain-containing protein [Capnocytophaga sp.]